MEEVGEPATKKLKQSDGDADEDTQPATSSIKGNYTSVCCYCSYNYTVCLLLALVCTQYNISNTEIFEYV